jgi:hypothetical protein
VVRQLSPLKRKLNSDIALPPCCCFPICKQLP